VLAVIASVQTVWWTPLNVDEELTLRVADFSFRNVFHIVSTQRGGGPLHFWLEHFLQGWWPGLASLRIPSLIFLCLALPAVALVVRELIGDEGAAAVVLLTAISPIPVLYATFGRPHTLLFAWLMWSTVLALRAANGGERRWWIAAGLVLGLSVFVHPTAPLYAVTVFASVLVYVDRPPRAVVRQAWPGAVALLVGFVPYYIRTLHVLTDRYGVGSGGQAGRTFSGRPVWEDALHFVAPGTHDLNYFTALALVGAVALVVTGRWRVLAFSTVMVAVPVLFFSFVPASGDSAIFFDRYMIPGTPAFLAVVASGGLAIGGRLGRLRFAVFAVLIAGLLVVEGRTDHHRLKTQHAIGLDAVTSAVRHEPAGTVLFGSSGTSGTIFSSFDYGHPANLLDRYVSLRVRSLQYVDDDACVRGLDFVKSTAPKRGLWLFYAAAPDERAAGSRAFTGVAGVTTQVVHRSYMVVRSMGALPPRDLIALGQKVRLAWRAAVPVNRRVNELLQADRQLLRSPPVCKPYGVLDDPGISPHWPPVKTTHQ
jgi:hypothetical protein